MKEYERLFVGGEWVVPRGTGTIDVVNPATEELVGRVPEATAADVDAAVAAARRAFDDGPWPRMAPKDRAAVVKKVADLINAEMQGLAELISAEVGSPVSWGTVAQVMAPAMILDYYASMASSFPFDQARQGLMGEVLVVKEPVGVVGAITPWNVPMFLAAAKLGPALVAGCTVVLKPAPESPLDANRLAELFMEAGLPEGVLSVVPAGREVGEHLVTHPGVDKISFTGSTAAGKRIGMLCGERLKRVSLELGGKSAAVILDDADLGTLLPALMPNAIMNNGEACIAQTRILAPRSRYQEVVDAVAQATASLHVGDPLDPSTDVGPLVAERQRDRVEGYIRSGLDDGAQIVTGGGRPASRVRGWYVEPTVFSGVDNGMRIAQEEIFGPVLVVIPFDDDADAVRIANDSRYGLCGSVWTADAARGLAVARGVRTGTYMVNSSIPVDYTAPFGGFKESGIGREFGTEGMELFCEVKSVIFGPGISSTEIGAPPVVQTSAG